MTPVRKPDDSEDTPTGDAPLSDEPELLDDADLLDADDAIVEDVDDAGEHEILDADDGIIECLDDDVSEEITGEVDGHPIERRTGEVTAPERVVSDVGSDDEPEEDPEEDASPDRTTGKHEVTPELLGADAEESIEDPLATFATDPARAVEVDEYAGGEDATGQMEMPQQPPWEASPEEATPPFAHDDVGEVEEPTGKVQLPFEEDPQDQTAEGGGPAVREEDESTPSFELEPVGRRRRSRRRPPRPEPAEEFIDESEDTAPSPDDPDVPWSAEPEQEPEAGQASPSPDADGLAFDDDTALGDDKERNTETVAGQDQVNWSALPDDEPRAMPDVGPTRVDGQSNPPGPQGDKTLIFDDPNADFEEPDEPEGPFLLIVQGEEEGREIELHREEVTLGRGPENDLVFPDIACSRRHAMIERQGDDWLVIDLGSGNGTLVNGRKIQREVLRDGDEIEVGSTVIQFNQPGAYPEDEPLGTDRTPPPSSTTVTGAATMADDEGTGWLTRITSDPKQRKYLIYGGAGLGGVILLMLIIKLIVGSGPSGPTPEEIKQRQAVEQRRQFDLHLNRAKALVTEKKWKDARLEVQLAAKVDPSSGQAQDYLNYINKQEAAASAIGQAKLAMGEQNWDVAVAALARVPEDSEYSEESKQLKIEIDNRLLDGLMNEGLKMMKDEQYNQAVLKFEEIIKRDPSNKEAQLARQQCEEKIEQAERSRRLASRRSHHRSRRRRRSKPERRSSGSLTGQVLALYRNGEIDRAIEKAELSSSAEHQKLLRQFRTTYRKAEKLASNTGQITKALSALKKAKALDRKISGGRGKYNDKLKDSLAKVYFVKGVDATTRDRYPEAYQAFVASRKYNPKNPLVDKQLHKLEKLAKKFYEEAYVIKSTNAEAALKKLNTVVKIVPPDHVYYTKAKNLKSKIQGPLGSSGGSSGF